ARPADLADKQPADGERVVANDLGIEPETALACKPKIVGVGLAKGLIGTRRSAVGFRGAHQAHHVLDVPTAVAELNSEPIEQFGMSWRRALGPEVIWSRDKASAEHHGPKPVDDDSRGEWVFFRGEPTRQVEPRCGLVGRRGVREKGRHLW